MPKVPFCGRRKELKSPDSLPRHLLSLPRLRYTHTDTHKHMANTGRQTGLDHLLHPMSLSSLSIQVPRRPGPSDSTCSTSSLSLSLSLPRNKLQWHYFIGTGGRSDLIGHRGQQVGKEQMAGTAGTRFRLFATSFSFVLLLIPRA